MKKLLLILLCLPMIGFTQEYSFGLESFFDKADYSKKLEYLKETSSNMSFLSESEKNKLVNDWMNTTEIYLGKNNNPEDLISIKKIIDEPSEEILEFLLEHLNEEIAKIWDVELEIIDSGMNNLRKKHPYLYIRKKVTYPSGSSYFSDYYMIKINNNSYQIDVTSKKGILLDKIILN